MNDEPEINVLREQLAGLEVERTHLLQAMQAARVGTWSWDLPDRVTWSESMYHIFGLAPGSFGETYRAYLALLHPEDRDESERIIGEAVACKGDLVFQHRIIRPDGEVRWIEGRGDAVLDEEGNLVGMRGVGIDVTNRRVAELALDLRARQQAVVAELGQRALGDVPLEDLTSEAAYAVAEMLDAELVTVLERLPGGRELLLRVGIGWPPGVVGVAKLGVGTESQAGYTLASDEPVIVSDLRTETRFRGHPVLLERGAVSGISTIIRGPAKPWGVLKAHSTHSRVFTTDDVNFLQSVANVLATAIERHRVAEARRLLADAGDVLNRELDYEETLRELARLLVDRLADWCVIHVVDEDGAIQEIEVAHRDPKKVELVRQFRERYRAPDASPSSVTSVLDAGQPMVFSEITDGMLDMIARNAEHFEMMRRIGMKSAMLLPMIARGRALGVIQLAMAESGRRYGSADVELGTQLADRAAIAVDNARLYREARETAAAREAFLSTASHELRTPLTSIMGFSRRLQLKARRGIALGDEEREEIDLVVGEAERMHRTLEIILDLARIESGRVELEIEPVDLRALIESETAAARARYPHAAFHGQFPKEARIIRSDGYRIRQVIANLVENAVKYGGPRPDVTLRLAYLPGGRASIGVRDRGPGIPPEDQERIFERFYQGRMENGGHHRGMGVGLYICKGIADRLHAEIGLTSVPGEGAEFTLTLPPAIGEGAFRSSPAISGRVEG